MQGLQQRAAGGGEVAPTDVQQAGHLRLHADQQYGDGHPETGLTQGDHCRQNPVRI